MKYTFILPALFTMGLSMPAPGGGGGGGGGGGDETVCKSDQTVVCSGNGNGGLLSLGNVLTGALGESCSGGDVYCCSSSDVDQLGLVNLDLNLQCSLNHVL